MAYHHIMDTHGIPWTQGEIEIRIERWCEIVERRSEVEWEGGGGK